ncbi:Outer membrane usher protein fimD precursor [Serratia quinivorans]|uniref:fimbria/pilus outer membrane usher protein n=1 Tax=Serratia quinivorans TaxID=137545 RepID=UPI00217C6C4E|nr:fimbria/pilus outer membrane usher protein [Serratia quinivorans]CAI1604321.1 Outer membrane usher protein fimD precursor [Serratia quinivorans]
MSLSGNKVLPYFIRYSLITFLIHHSLLAQAKDKYNPQFLEIGGGGMSENVDLSLFDDGDAQPPGDYQVEVFLNRTPIERTTINFKLNKDKSKLVPCLKSELIKKLGIKPTVSEELNEKLKISGECVELRDYIPTASVEFDFSSMGLRITLPQIALDQHAQGYVDPSEWDEGIPALMFNYGFSGSNTKGLRGNGDSNNYFTSLNSRAILGAWRLNNNYNWTVNNNKITGQNIGTSLQRDIIPLKAQMLLGDSATPSDIFDSVQIRGVQVYSDDDMLPDSLKGYAPVIRGIAQSNARVTVKQNGFTIYETYVSPGAFAIRDLYPAVSGGDFQVEITEANGSVRRFTQPFSSVPLLQREGYVKFSAATGEYRTGYNNVHPIFGQGTVLWGLQQGFTVYGGTIGANNYRSLALGVGKNLGDFGAFSFDITQAGSEMKNDIDKQGQSYRILYAKSLVDFGTDLRLMGYRYSTSGFYTFQETNDIRSDAYQYGSIYHKRSRFETTISQGILDNGSLFATYVRQNYWQDNGTLQQWQFGYNGSWNRVNYGFSWNLNRSPWDNKTDKQFAFTLSIPLDGWSKNTWATYNFNSDNTGRSAQQVGVNGTLLKDNNLNYNLSQSYANRNEGYGGTAGVNYAGTYGYSNIGYNYNRDSRQVNYGLQGGIVLHQHGVTFSQPLGESMALVEAPGASGVSVVNNTGVKTDWRGYTIVPFISPYRRSQIMLDTTNLSDDIELENASDSVVATRGALVRANFTAKVGKRVLVTLIRADGRPVPFGASASGSVEGASTGIVDENGQVYLSGLPMKGTIKANWGSQQCLASYQLSEQQTRSGILLKTLDCK